MTELEGAPLIVQPQANGVLVEDRQRNLSVLQVEQPLLVTCPFDGEQWRFHTQEQADMFQKHLDWHANGLAAENRAMLRALIEEDAAVIYRVTSRMLASRTAPAPQPTAPPEEH